MIWAAFILGLFGSLHCVGMCGPIVLALPLTTRDKSKVILQSTIYHAGRILTYAILGAILGSLGWMISLAGFQKILTIGLGITLILSAVFSFSIERQFVRKGIFVNMVAWIKSRFSKLLVVSGASSAFKLGMLNGILPCGLVYIALAGAVTTGGSSSGAFYMSAFGFGTLPMLLAVMIIGNVHKQKVFRFRKWIPVILVLFGMLLIFRGMIADMPADLDLWRAEGFQTQCH